MGIQDLLTGLELGVHAREGLQPRELRVPPLHLRVTRGVRLPVRAGLGHESGRGWGTRAGLAETKGEDECGGENESDRRANLEWHRLAKNTTTATSTLLLRPRLIGKEAKTRFGRLNLIASV